MDVTPTSSAPLPVAPAESPATVGLRYGLYVALVWIIVDVMLRVTGLSFRVFTVYLPASLAVTVVGMVLAHRDFKNRNRYMSWQQGFIIGVVVMLVSTIIAQLFNWTYVNFIDPDYPARFRADMQAWFDSIPNMPEASKDEALAEMSEEKMKSLGQSIKKAAQGAVIGALIVSALVALFTRRQPAQFE